MDRRLRILVVSDVIPVPTMSGNMVMHRFLTGVPEADVLVATDQDQAASVARAIALPRPYWANRLRHTRFAKIFNAWENCLWPTHSARVLYQSIKMDRPDMILTVAYGPIATLARRAAASFNLPLVSVFQDWWPDIVQTFNWCRPILERRFRRLYDASALAICVSEGMKDALGDHRNAQVLHDLPGWDLPVSIPNARTPRFRVVYAGNMSEVYAPMLQALAHQVSSHPILDVRLIGPNPHWPNGLLERSGLYGGFLPRGELLAQLASADALLVAMSFAQRDRRRSETSFPGKLIEYCRFGKPIVIWAPDYSSAARWAESQQGALLVTSDDPVSLVSALIQLAHSDAWKTRYSLRAVELANTQFEPNRLRRRFAEMLYAVAKQGIR